MRTRIEFLILAFAAANYFLLIDRTDAASFVIFVGFTCWGLLLWLEGWEEHKKKAEK